MATSRPWLKLWTAITTDPDFEALDLVDQARWMRLLCHVGAHGEEGWHRAD